MNRVSPLPRTGSKDSADSEDRSYHLSSLEIHHWYHAGDSGSESFHSCVSQASLTSSKVAAMTLTSPLPDTSQASSELSVISGK